MQRTTDFYEVEEKKGISNQSFCKYRFHLKIKCDGSEATTLVHPKCSYVSYMRMYISVVNRNAFVLKNDILW